MLSLYLPLMHSERHLLRYRILRNWMEKLLAGLVKPYRYWLDRILENWILEKMVKLDTRKY